MTVARHIRLLFYVGVTIEGHKEGRKERKLREWAKRCMILLFDFRPVGLRFHPGPHATQRGGLFRPISILSHRGDGSNVGFSECQHRETLTSTKTGFGVAPVSQSLPRAE